MKKENTKVRGFLNIKLTDKDGNIKTEKKISDDDFSNNSNGEDKNEK